MYAHRTLYHYMTCASRKIDIYDFRPNAEIDNIRRTNIAMSCIFIFLKNPSQTATRSLWSRSHFEKTTECVYRRIVSLDYYKYSYMLLPILYPETALMYIRYIYKYYKERSLLYIYEMAYYDLRDENIVLFYTLAIILQ